MCALWLLRGLTKEERDEVYRLLPSRTVEVMEKQLNASWREEDLTEDIRRMAVVVVDMLRRMGKIPRVHLASVEDMMSRLV